ncbi:MAG: tRNA (adenosine(37)-N6)-threonylcarbamoyltransferase complex ATPase subunit type 1 TsaE, partial [Actinomycetes bacterium]
PPSTAIDETPDSVAAALARGGGILARVDGRPAGVILVQPENDRVVSLHRVSVHPDFQRHGVASTMVTAAADYAAELGYTEVELFAREELGELVTFWQHRGFRVTRPAPHGVMLSAALPVAVTVPTAADMQRLGERLATLLAPGDLVIATGDLGAGKTTLTQGIGRGLGATGTVISPTFVLSRVHRAAVGRPDLVHVDAYRLSSATELEDLDLDAHVPTAVTVVEWGEGLAPHRLEVDIRRSAYPDPAVAEGDARTVLIRGVGDRWRAADLARLRDGQGRG